MKWRRGLALLGLSALLGCPEPSDTLFTPVHEPLEVGPGLFQVTFSNFPEYSRGFTPAGDTILFSALRFEGAGTAWEMLGANVDGSAPLEEAALYRKAIRQRLAALNVRPHDRLYTYWIPGNSEDFFGPAACPKGARALTAWHLGMLLLPSEDGVALSGIPARDIRLPVSDTVTDNAALLEFRIRYSFAEAAADSGRNPFGPAADSVGGTALYSDGDTVWSFDLHDAAAAPVPVGVGLFPAVSPDGTLRASAIPRGVDSTLATETVSAGIRSCRQDEWSLTATGWTSVITRWPGGDTVRTLDGTEPVFDPVGNHVVVRRASGLWVVDLATGAERIVSGSFNGFGAAVSPDGKYLAFTLPLRAAKEANVFYVKLDSL